MVQIRNCLTLKACRVIAGVEVKEIASYLGVVKDTIYSWEKGRTLPDVTQIKKIIDFYAEKGYIVNMDDIIF